MNIVRRQSIGQFVINNYFYFALGVYFLMMVNGVFRAGVIMTVVMLIVLATHIKDIRYLSKNGLIVLCYIGLNLVSIIWMDLNTYGINIYIQEIITSILPIVLFFAVKNCDRDKVLDSILYGTLICVLIGAVLFVWMPDFYRQYEATYGFAVSSRIEHCRQGMASFIGRIPLGTYTVVAAAIALKKYIDENYSFKNLITFFILIAGSIMTAQRSSWFGSIILVVYMLYKLLKSGRRKIFFQLLAMILLGVGVMAYYFRSELLAATQIGTKSLGLVSAVLERSSTWNRLIGNTNSMILGGGLGTGGHRARVISADTVTDGNFVKVIGEIGYIGLFMLLIIAFIVLFKYWAKKREILGFFVVVFILIQMTGSNIAALQVTAPLFWAFMGLSEYKETNDI